MIDENRRKKMLRYAGTVLYSQALTHAKVLVVGDLNCVMLKCSPEDALKDLCSRFKCVGAYHFSKAGYTPIVIPD